jgi:LysM repeat protein
MEDDDIDTSSAGSLLPVALAVLAIVLGGAGLYFGMTASQRISPLADTMEAGSSSAARLEKDIAGLETRLAELSAQNSELENTLSRMRLYSNQSEQAVKQLASGMKENRTELVKLAGRLNELLSSGVPSAAAAPVPSGAVSAPSATSIDSTELPASSVESTVARTTADNTYAIEAGDNFVRVASKLGVGLQSLLDANPGADPRRLRIGQEIKIPNN